MSRFPIGVRVADGDVVPTAWQMNELLEERDRLAADVEELKARGAGAVVEDWHAGDVVRRVEAAIADEIAGDVAPAAIHNVARRVVDELLGDPVARRLEDGRVELLWPVDRDAAGAIVARPVLEELVAQVNALRTPVPPTKDAVRDAIRTVEDVFDAHYTPCAGCAALWDGVPIGPAVVRALVELGWLKVGSP